MKVHSVWRPLALLALAAAGLALGGFAVNAGATRAIALTTTPKLAPACKLGQKSTLAHPCRTLPKCKPGQKSSSAHPCTKPKPTPTPTTTRATTTTASTGSQSAAGTTAGGSSNVTTTSGAGSGIPQLQADGCPVGQSIPQGTNGGDGDEDNAAGFDDGDGCL